MTNNVAPRAGLRLLVALALALAALVAPGLTTAAHAATTTLEVSVLDSSSENPIPGVTVEVFESDPEADPGASPVATTTTGDGPAELTIEQGEYWVRGTLDGYTPAVFWDLFTGVRSEITLYLERDWGAVGTIGGRVLDNAGKPLGSDRGHLEFYDVSLGGEAPDVHTTHSNGIGRYSATLPVGRYRVLARDDEDDLQPAWVGGDTSWQSAQTFTITTNGKLALPDVSLRPGPSVSGRITDTSGGPVQHAVVTLIRAGEAVTSARTDRTGAYTIRNVPPGDYLAHVGDDFGEYVGEWFDDAATSDDAKVVTVTTSNVVLNAALTPAPAIDEPSRLTGLVTDHTGAPVRAAYVTVYRKVVVDGRTGWEFPQSALTNRAGRYAFPDLGPGTYTLEVRDDETGAFPAQWYGGGFTERTAREIVVPAGGVTAETMVVAPWATVSGRVTSPSRATVADQMAWVQLFDADGGQVDEARVAGDGSYRFRYVQPGDYTVRASGVQWLADGDDSYLVDLVSQWWRNAYSAATASKLRVTSSGVSNVDFTLGSTLSNVGRPTVAGNAGLGATLTASPGAWNRLANTAFAYQWTRDGAAIRGATSARYTTTTADLGRSIAVRVTATDRNGSLTSGAAASAAKVVKGTSRVTAAATGAKRSATVKVRLTLQGVAAKTTTGVVRVYEGKKLKKTLTIRKGSGTVKVTGLRKGTRTLTVRFAGSGTHTASSKAVRVKVR